MIGVIPVIGEAADIAKTINKADDIADIAKLANKTDDAIDAVKAIDKVDDFATLNKNAKTIAKSSPTKIPENAIFQSEIKKGYVQIKYSWESNGYKYVSRWHTRTPNAPIWQENSWVVERRINGIGYGKNARPKKEEILIGKNKWISKKEWKEAIFARKNGISTKNQKELLGNGHWKDN